MAFVPTDPPKRQWVSVPGLCLNEDANSAPSVYLDNIKTHDLTVGFCLEDVFTFYGTPTFTIVSVNKLKPRDIFIAAGIKDFEKELFG